MPSPLPLFPLHVVLFPGTALPLHIFELRYQQMLRDCLDGDSRMGIVPTGEKTERPPIGSVGCRGHIHSVERLPDGRSNIVVVGEERVTVQEYVETEQPYAMAYVEAVEDTGPEAGVEETEQLREAVDSYLSVVARTDWASPDPVEWATDPGAFSFQVAAVVELNRADQQRLLEFRSSAQRVHALIGLLPGVTARAQEQVAWQRRAAGNGRGAHWPTGAGGA